jgi:signal transduction histidine kinase
VKDGEDDMEQPCPPAAELAREVDDLRRRTAELAEAVTARDEFIATLGHELRNPLSPMVLQVGHLIDQVKRAERGVVETGWLAPRLQAFEARMQRLVDVLDRLLDVSLMQGGRLSVVLEGDVDLCEVTREVCARFERELTLARCPLTLDAPRPAVGRWDRVRLEQIVHNLVSNAIRYGAGRPIHVAVSTDGERADLTVRDQGIGIAPADQQRIFDRFERAGRRVGGGFGLGLWIVRNLCRAFGGDIRVESQLGQGAAFHVTLPRSPRA